MKGAYLEKSEGSVDELVSIQAGAYFFHFTE